MFPKLCLKSQLMLTVMLWFITTSFGFHFHQGLKCLCEAQVWKTCFYLQLLFLKTSVSQNFCYLVILIFKKNFFSRYGCTRATLIALFCTFFDVFNIPVFWPILVMYFIILFVLTMKRQIKVSNCFLSSFKTCIYSGIEMQGSSLDF